MSEKIMNDILVRMREVTQPYHMRINHHPLITQLMAHDMSLSLYCSVLIAYFHLYEKLESTINTFIARHPIALDYALRSKCGWLKEDLHFLAQDPLLDSNLPSRPIQCPEIESLGQLIGVLYPLEGATLGGQIISQKLLKNHALTIHGGARFFNAYTERTPAYWQAFCQFAAIINDNETECKKAETAAVLTFSLFERILDDYQPPRKTP